MSKNEAEMHIINNETIERRVLEDILLHIDKNNPKFELNYCYVDDINIVSTDTRVLCVAEHGLNINKPFFIDRTIVEKAVREKKADSFILNPNRIAAIQNGNEIMTFSMSYPVDMKNFRFPDYHRIIPETINTKISFVDNSQINGLFAAKKVAVNPKYLPKSKYGYIGINEKNLPVVVQDGEYKIKTIIMPIVDKFKEFDENGFI